MAKSDDTEQSGDGEPRMNWWQRLRYTIVAPDDSADERAADDRTVEELEEAIRRSDDKERAIGLKQRQTFRAAYNAGVKMIFGTDNGAVFPAGQNALQFAKMVEWGMPPLEAIRAATRNAAQALAREGDVGAIEVGRYGDFVAVKGDPLQDIRLLEHPAVVIKGGERVK